MTAFLEGGGVVVGQADRVRVGAAGAQRLRKILGRGVQRALAVAEVVEEVAVEAQVVAVAAALGDEQRATGSECGEHAGGRGANRARREGVESVGGPDDVERSDRVVELLHQGFVASGPDERRAKRLRGLQQ